MGPWEAVDVDVDFFQVRVVTVSNVGGFTDKRHVCMLFDDLLLVLWKTISVFVRRDKPDSV